MAKPTAAATLHLVEGTGTRSFTAQATNAGDWLATAVLVQDDNTGTFPVSETTLGTFSSLLDTGTGTGIRGRILWAIAKDAAGGTRTVTVTPSVGTRSYRAWLTVARGSPGPGNVAGIKTAQTISFRRDGYDSMLLVALVDWSTGAVGTVQWIPGGATVASQVGTNATYITGRWDGSGPQGTALTGSNGTAYTTPAVAVLEILGTGDGPPGGEGPQPSPLLLPQLSYDPMLQGVIYPMRPWQRRFQWVTQPWLGGGDAAAGGPLTVTVGQAVGSDSAQPVTSRKIAPVGQPSETDVAQPIGPAHARVLGQPATTATAQPVTARGKVGQVSELDTAQPISRRKTRTLGQPAEVDTAQPIGRVKRATLGQPGATSTAQPIGRAHLRTLGQPTETNTAQLISRAHRRTLGQPVETDVAQPITRAGAPHIVGQAAAASTAQPITRAKTRTLGQPATTATAQPIGRAHRAPVGQAGAASTAQPIGRIKIRGIGQPGTVATAQPVSRRKLVAVGQAAGTLAALPMVAIGGAPDAVYGAARISGGPDSRVGLTSGRLGPVITGRRTGGARIG